MEHLLRQWPKAELHLHLEGSIEPQTALELDPSLSLDQVRSWYTFTDFAGFIQSYVRINRLLRGPAEYTLITRRLLASLEEQGVTYAEINVSAGVILWREQSVEKIFAAISEAVRRSSVEVRWIFDAVRQFGPGPAMRVAELAAERMEDGVVGFGLGGDELRGPVADFADVFRWAEGRGLALVPHAGETAGADSIWGAIRLGARRIGHGIRAVDDPNLMSHLRDHDIPLEVCLTSNVCTGAVRSMDEHPVRKLYDAGVPITLNTDDPGIFGTTLVREYSLAAQRFGFSEAELRGIAENAFRYRITAAHLS